MLEKLDILPPAVVEATWAIFRRKQTDNLAYRVNKILVGSIYVSPRSKYKVETINHIIETIHYVRSLYDNDIHYLFGGDFNRLDISEILDAHGALEQFVSTCTRKQAVLKIILTEYSKFVTELKATNPRKWYGMAKKIGALDQMTQGDLHIFLPR